MSSDKISRGTALVAVAFDEQTPALVAACISLARRFSMELRFLHSVPSQQEVEPFDYSSAMFAYPLAVAPSDDELLENGQKKMAALVRALPDNLRFSRVVKIGHEVPTIIAEAVASRANLIIAGYDPVGYTTLSQGMSVAISLMHEAPLPVLVLNDHCALDFTKERLRLLFADDLEPSTMEAARKTYELAAKLGRAAAVRHLHVHGDFREMIKDSWRATWTESLAMLPFVKRDESLDALLDREYSARAGRLAGQGQPWRSAADAAGVAVTIDTRTGSVADELHQAVLDDEPDLLVFGRHRFLRTRPFLIGRMPLRAMLHEGRAVLLVPSSQELYARLPFPAAAAAEELGALAAPERREPRRPAPGAGELHV